jgi:hypothetical protein
VFSVKQTDLVIVLLVIAVDDLRNALFALLVGADVMVLVLALIAVYYVSKNQDKVASAAGGLSFLTGPLHKLKLA